MNSGFELMPVDEVQEDGGMSRLLDQNHLLGGSGQGCRDGEQQQQQEELEEEEGEEEQDSKWHEVFVTRTTDTPDGRRESRAMQGGSEQGVCRGD